MQITGDSVQAAKASAKTLRFGCSREKAKLSVAAVERLRRRNGKDEIRKVMQSQIMYGLPGCSKNLGFLLL